MRTIKLTVAYDGTDFVGWQRQENGASIQAVVEDTLGEIAGTRVILHAAGRTDAGVHALAQVASARIATVLDDATLVRALNAKLPESIRVIAVETVDDRFHARFSAAGKRYEYRIWNGPAVPPFLRLYTWQVPEKLDVGRMQEASLALVGAHDFAAFRSSRAINASTIREVTEAGWRMGPDALLVFDIAGRGFLRYMVRSLVGTLLEIGRGQRPVSDIAALLASPDRSAAGCTAPSRGLFLVNVLY
jgi:tRNA pseudouridine38-40 synthase